MLSGGTFPHVGAVVVIEMGEGRSLVTRGAESVTIRSVSGRRSGLGESDWGSEGGGGEGGGGASSTSLTVLLPTVKYD